MEYYTHFISVSTILREGSINQNQFCNNCHRIMDYAELEGVDQDHPVQLLVLHRTPQESKVSESTVQMLLELWQTWGCDHCFGEPVPEPNRPLGEKPFHDTKPEPSPVHAVSSGLITDTTEQRSVLASPLPLMRSCNCSEGSPQSSPD